VIETSGKYQKQVKGANERKIIQILNKESLTFTELIDRSKLSRAVVNQHLKDLERENIVKKEYKDGKILNVLQAQKVRLSEFLLNQLSGLGVPGEVIDKGRSILTDEFVRSMSLIYRLISENMIKLGMAVQKRSTKGKRERIESPLDGLTFPLISDKIRSTFDLLVEETPSKDEDRVIKVLTELSPYSFHIALLECIYEHTVYKTNKKLDSGDVDGVEKNIAWRLIVAGGNYMKNLDEISNWWLNDILPYLQIGTYLLATMALQRTVIDSLNHRKPEKTKMTNNH
jgi:DNA-binding transcriptional ArsR family regulator